MSVLAEAEARYRRAGELVEKIRARWMEEGEPLTTQGGATGRALVPHPLVKMLAEAERDADRYSRALMRRHPGPDPVAAVTAEVGLSPAAELRAVR